MTNKRLVAAVLPVLLAWTSASAGVLEIPAAAAREPLVPSAVIVVAQTQLVLAPSLVPTEGLSLAAAGYAAPAPTAVSAAAPNAAVATAAFARAPAAEAASVPEAAAQADEPQAAPLAAAEQAFAARGASAAAPRFAAGARAAAPDLDALFDGRRAAAAADPAPLGPGSGARAAAPARKSRLLRGALLAAFPLAAAVAGVAAPHAALLGVHALGQAAYWLTNPLAFLYTIPQIHRMLARRSGEVSASMTIVGLVAALATTVCFGYDGKDLMMYRNLAQAAGFAVMFGLVRLFSRARGAPPSRARAFIETGAVVLGVGAAILAGGPAFMAAARVLPAIGSLLVPLQVLAGFGFTYMMYAQLKKMRTERSSGDSSSGMMWAFLGTKTIWVWSFTTMLAFATAPAWQTLAVGAAFSALSWLAARAALSRLLRATWRFLPERVTLGRWSVARAQFADAIAFLALSAMVMLLSVAGWAAFAFLLGVPPALGSTFAMYAIYTVQNLVSCVATLETLRLQKRYDRAERAKSAR